MRRQEGFGFGEVGQGGFVEKKMELSSFMGSALINMNGNCRDLILTRRIFDAMAKKDVVT